MIVYWQKLKGSLREVDLLKNNSQSALLHKTGGQRLFLIASLISSIQKILIRACTKNFRQLLYLDKLNTP
ncbi:hypothetical protein [Streptococcus pantholopis]|uniref:Uncharacterized protein n=1 Tax=Streptococcus pantholopis TaxID=1811193 RepID=A0A172Q8G4_9STRE|nr:hypothetical protein [Streptococcus pantholopis]AND79685.1 hypothetical protein A0O21_06430 [Streptococcus pantholopis]